MMDEVKSSGKRAVGGFTLALIAPTFLGAVTNAGTPRSNGCAPPQPVQPAAEDESPSRATPSRHCGAGGASSDV
ncbi:hypothetical protein FHU29_003295 [Hoyosella altamirensis]|uniref:Uncharacterized protein n=1 Tax=Hoyosella altamirensis TaxID=616997 RepID=A0A839RRT9_9ACTN|nr:hypothetical protein [Hoyosella altamirensis]